MTERTARYEERTLPNGFRVVVEELPAARSAAVGFFVSTGSRDETPEIMGVSHFLEHMSFKATKKRSALDVSRALDAMGSRANAFTSWERTVYYAQVLPEFCPGAMSLIAEMIDPAFLEEDFDCEKKVILEEIEMYNDRPEFLLFEGLMERRYAGHPLAGAILGTRETITALPREAMRRYHASRYHASRIVLAVAGAVRAEDVFAHAATLASPGTVEETRTGESAPPRNGGFQVRTRPADVLEHYIAAWRGPSVRDLRARYAAGILSILLGDEEGSRLSWALTHPGLADRAEAGHVPFRDDGLLYAGFSCLPDAYGKARGILHEEIGRLRSAPPDAEEFERARTKFASRTVLASESTRSRMTGIGADALDGLPYHDLATELAMILAIRPDEVMALASTMGEPETEAAIGPLSEERAR